MPVRPQDLDEARARRRARSSRGSTPRERERLLACGELVEVRPGARVHGDADAGRHLYLVVRRRGHAPPRRTARSRRLGPGDHFGELALARRTSTAARRSRPRRAARRSCASPAACWAELERTDPGARREGGDRARRRRCREDLARLSGDMGLLLRGRSLPRAPRGDGAGRRRGARASATGTPPARPAARRGRRRARRGGAARAEAGVARDAGLHRHRRRAAHGAPLGGARRSTRTRWGSSCSRPRTGSRPRSRVRMGPSRGTRQVVERRGDGRGRPRRGSPRAIAERMARLAPQDDRRSGSSTGPPTRPRRGSAERGWDDAARLLRIRRQATVRLVSCGELYALSMGPLLPSTGAHPRLQAPAPATRGSPSSSAGATRATAHGHRAAAPRGRAARRRTWRASTRRWLAVDGRDERRRLQRAVHLGPGLAAHPRGRGLPREAHRPDRRRHRRGRATGSAIISIAGPSSSGQDHVHQAAHRPAPDRRREPGRHLARRLLRRPRAHPARRGRASGTSRRSRRSTSRSCRTTCAACSPGEAVRTARYDFLTGTSHPDGGPVIQLRPGDVLLLEGIHGLNPRLLGAIPRAGRALPRLRPPRDDAALRPAHPRVRDRPAPPPPHRARPAPARVRRGREHRALALGAGRRARAHLPVPGRGRRGVRHGAHLRAGGAEGVRRALPARGAARATPRTRPPTASATSSTASSPSTPTTSRRPRSSASSSAAAGSSTRSAGAIDDRDVAQIVIDTVGALVVVLDREGRIRRWNAACERATGLHSRARCSGSRSGTCSCPRSATGCAPCSTGLLAGELAEPARELLGRARRRAPARLLVQRRARSTPRARCAPSSRPGSTSPTGRGRRTRCGARRRGSRRSPRRRACSPPGSTTRRRSTPWRGGSASSSATARSSASSRRTASGSCRWRSTTRRRSGPRCAAGCSPLAPQRDGRGDHRARVIAAGTTLRVPRPHARVRPQRDEAGVLALPRGRDEPHDRAAQAPAAGDRPHHAHARRRRARRTRTTTRRSSRTSPTAPRRRSRTRGSTGRRRRRSPRATSSSPSPRTSCARRSPRCGSPSRTCAASPRARPSSGSRRSTWSACSPRPSGRGSGSRSSSRRCSTCRASTWAGSSSTSRRWSSGTR